MKKLIGTIIVVLLLLGGIYVLIGTNAVNTFGTKKYYVKTTANYTVDNSQYKIYTYKTNGYDKDGNEKELEYTATKILKVDRFLKIYYKNNKVTSYEEVNKSELPDKVKEIYKVD